MGRPPCCDKIGMKKGPWTPEEDIILVSYIQEHGPGNWRAVPANTGLLRCSKSCRLRWTNYLRPGIKRGNFTEHEEKMIIHLQALLGNRTDNDIKNYWNTHLKKKLAKLKGHDEKTTENGNSSDSQSITKGQWEKRLQTDIHMAKQALCEALSLDKSDTNSSIIDSKFFPMAAQNKQIQTSSTYASSAENIARLLENWSKKSPKKPSHHHLPGSSESTTQSYNNCSVGMTSSPSEGQISNLTFLSSNSEVSQLTPETGIFQDHESKPSLEMTQMPFSLLENWLFDDAGAQGQDGDFMEMALEETADLF
ncbi:hypothetical protein DH2020_013046 [Rehmannia glutinosa]|uniref:R2R3-MYB protein n=1 Tax=Rehmannia glutinosa TaxID=99300 RepID=A0ABR0X132_REHGL